MNVYVIAAVGLESPSKIGKAKDVDKRLMTLQVGSPLRLYVYGSRWCADAKIEKSIHAKLRHKRLHGEWFDIPANLAMSHVDAACSKANKKLGHEIP